MANIYFLRMNDPIQVNNYEFRDTNKRFPAKFAPGDLCFVRLQGEFSPVKIKRLWKFVGYTPDGTCANFEPYWKDAAGNELFFNELEVINHFIALKFFVFNTSLCNNTHRPGHSFAPLAIDDQAVFDSALQSVSTFNAYISDPKNFRKLEVVAAFDSASDDIQLTKDGKGEYALNCTAHIGKDITDNFEGNKPNRYIAHGELPESSTHKGKMLQHLITGTGDYTLQGFYELFCAPFSPPRKKAGAAAAADSATSSVEDEDGEIDESTPAADSSATGTDYRYENVPSIGGENLIIYGTPGCGKSHALDTRLSSISEEFKSRVTFHLDYTYTDFVGQILPKVDAAKNVTYEFIPGPFTMALETAIRHPDKKVALIIEEINRGNAASIFGDLFQLLDRDTSGTSQYKLTNKQITDYFKNQTDLPYTLSYIKIPANLSIYATMNTGDQNVFTLDTAFKRRWDFEKLSNIFNSNDDHQDKCVPGMNNVTWKTFVTTINAHMISDGALDSEDKQLGKYFVTENQLVDYLEKDDVKTKKFAYKVLEYLWNDVAKFDRDRWFDTAKYKTLDAVIEQWCTHAGKDVFNSLITFTFVTPPASAATATDESGDAE